MQNENIRHIYASPFLRTVQTAHQVADVLSVPVRIEYGLSEGLFESESLLPIHHPSRLSNHHMQWLDPRCVLTSCLERLQMFK